ncbi:CBS domain-containing protein, partial [Alphaproteobacteria bacterium]|nr:CBS domain-containing protein [Alphaproteobacteria bacterium]
MKNENLEKKVSFKNWLIKKLLTSDSTKEEVLNYIASNKDDDNVSELEDNNEKSLIKNILSLNDKSVEDIMVPRAEIVFIKDNQNIEEILSIVENESHSRMPVCRDNLDSSKGFLHVKDLLINIFNKNFELNKIMRDILYVAPKSPILDLLKRMRSSSIHMGLVVDEFGGVDGLVTIEDLVEEIVGEIEDEHDADDVEELLVKIDKDKILVDASYKIIDLEKFFNIKIELNYEDEIDTIGGMLSYIANKVPKNNQVYKYKEILQL